MVPTRRRYLRRYSGFAFAALAGLAGCTGDTPGDTDDGTDESPTPTANGTDAGETRPTGTGGPGVTLVAVDGVGIPVEAAVEIVREAATPDYPPRLQTTLTNTGEQEIRLGEGRAVHFEYVVDNSEVLVFLPGEDENEYPAEPDCWRLTDDVAVTEEYQTFALEPGASRSRLVDLYARPGEDACLPVGEFRFETTVSIVSDNAEPQSSAQWGFTILLE